MKSTLLTCCFLFLTLMAKTQLPSSPIDSLLGVIEENRHDTAVAKAYLAWGSHIFGQNPDSAFLLWNHSLALIEQNLSDHPSLPIRNAFQLTESDVYGKMGNANNQQGRTQQALHCYEKSMEINKAIGNQAGIAVAFGNLAAVYEDIGENKKAILCYERGLAIKKEIGDRRGMGLSYLNIGYMYDIQGNVEQGLTYYHAGLNIFKEFNDKRLIAAALNNIAYVHDNQGDYAKGLAYYTECLKIQEEIEDKIGTGYTLNNIGLLYSKQSRYEEAREYYERSLQVRVAINHQRGIATSLSNLGKLQQKLGNPEKALALFQQSLQIREEIQNKHGILVSAIHIGNLYLDLGRTQEAQPYLDRGMQLAFETGIPEDIKSAAFASMRLHKRQGEYQKALEMHELYIQMRDSINNQDTRANIVRQEARFQAAKQEEEIAELGRKEAQILARSERQQKWLWAAGAGMLSLGLLIVLIYARQRNKRNRQALEFAQKKAELEQQAFRAQMNPHFIFNSLNAIQKLYVEGDLNKAGDYTADFGQLMRKILDNSGKPVVQLSEDLHCLELYLNLEQGRMEHEEVLTYSIQVDDSIDPKSMHIPPLIIQPYVENAIWHGIVPQESGKVEVELTLHDLDHLRCTVRDNGVGIETSKNRKASNRLLVHADHESKGMKITAQRLGSEQALLARELESGGTEITLIIPIEIR